MNCINNISTLSEAEEALAREGILVDTVYQDVFANSGYHYGVQRENHGIHIYFNLGRLNHAYFTPALEKLYIFQAPRPDAMVGQKHYIRHPNLPQVRCVH